MEFQAEWDGHGGKDDERTEDVDGPAGAPGDVVAGIFCAAEEKESGNGDIDGEYDCKNVSKALARIRPEPVRGTEFYGDPDGGENEKILPTAWSGALCGGEKQQRKKNEGGDDS